MSMVDCVYYGYVGCMNSYMKCGLGFMLGVENNYAWYKYMISILFDEISVIIICKAQVCSCTSMWNCMQWAPLWSIWVSSVILCSGYHAGLVEGKLGLVGQWGWKETQSSGIEGEGMRRC